MRVLASLLSPMRMVFLTLVAVAAWLGYRMAAPQQDAPTLVAVPKAAHSLGKPSSTISDPTEVFQKAFWKRPTANDHILHAERREWSDAHGVKQWQWFIAVQPSPELVKHLRDDNAFNLRRSKGLQPVENSPEWFRFKADGAEAFEAPRGTMQLSFRASDNVLYATDAGGGFHAGAPEPLPKTTRPMVSMGRLPTTHPPDPRNQ
jgi:hypothetical protein